jgi:hypothetical protein
MQEVVKLAIGVVFLIIGYFAGGFLARITKEELKQGKKWFKLIVFASLIGVVLSLIFKNDVLLFTFSFIAIFTSRSLKR